MGQYGYVPLGQHLVDLAVDKIATDVEYVTVCDSNVTNDSVIVQNGQTPLSIAQQLGYISVVEILKNITTVTVATPTVDEKYKVVFPERMEEAPVDSDEEGGKSDIIIFWLLRIILQLHQRELMKFRM